jgi:hypothetical protein
MKELKKANREAIIANLRHYAWTKEHLQDLLREIGDSGDLLPEVAHTRRVIKAIEEVERLSRGKKADVLQEYFFNGKPWQEVTVDKNMSQHSLFYNANQIIEELAKLLGVVV